MDAIVGWHIERELEFPDTDMETNTDVKGNSLLKVNKESWQLGMWFESFNTLHIVNAAAVQLFTLQSSSVQLLMQTTGRQSPSLGAF